MSHLIYEHLITGQILVLKPDQIVHFYNLIQMNCPACGMYPCVCGQYSGLFGVQGASLGGYSDGANQPYGAQYGADPCSDAQYGGAQYGGAQFGGGALCPICGFTPCACNSGGYGGYSNYGGFKGGL